MTDKIEETKRDMYQMLAGVKATLKRGFAPISNLKLFEDAMEAHLEALRLEAVDQRSTRDAFEYLATDYTRKHEEMRDERDEIQGRLHAVDSAYSNQCALVQRQAADVERLKVAAQAAGEELRLCQTNLRHWREESGKLHSKITAFESGEMYQKLKREGEQHLDDCRSAEKLSDDLDEKLRDARAVIAQQEQLIVGQRLALGDLFIKNAALAKRLASVGCDSVKVEATPRVEASASYIDPYDIINCDRFHKAMRIQNHAKCFNCGQAL